MIVTVFPSAESLCKVRMLLVSYLEPWFLKNTRLESILDIYEMSSAALIHQTKS
ncbi:predicted protein [Botrytis cinerea T4]|uniref:Uncharacterized protein n=1 Tax=Botryotinia fuckeliana (strain T4) TaxID=999810 RepID=G2Y144_BOTF4|nr:predicted protein [Botrytis cinerea T4]